MRKAGQYIVVLTHFLLSSWLLSIRVSAADLDHAFERLAKETYTEESAVCVYVIAVPTF